MVPPAVRSDEWLPDDLEAPSSQGRWLARVSTLTAGATLAVSVVQEDLIRVFG